MDLNFQNHINFFDQPMSEESEGRFATTTKNEQNTHHVYSLQSTLELLGK